MHSTALQKAADAPSTLQYNTAPSTLQYNTASSSSEGSPADDAIMTPDNGSSKTMKNVPSPQQVGTRGLLLDLVTVTEEGGVQPSAGLSAAPNLKSQNSHKQHTEQEYSLSAQRTSALRQLFSQPVGRRHSGSRTLLANLKDSGTAPLLTQIGSSLYLDANPALQDLTGVEVRMSSV
jgi:hypothetical protein